MTKTRFVKNELPFLKLSLSFRLFGEYISFEVDTSKATPYTVSTKCAKIRASKPISREGALVSQLLCISKKIQNIIRNMISDIFKDKIQERKFATF